MQPAPDRVDAEQWRLIEDLFERVVDLPPAEREALLTEVCGTDSTVRRAVESLLKADGQAQGFVGRAIGSTAESLQQDLRPGTLIGAFRIVEEIGHGGMGAVYLAERADQEFNQLVAIKVVRRGFESGSAATRFRLERQILARLDHPHIVRLTDGGQTGDGRPYLVMEYVRGSVLTTYADEVGLDVRERLELMARIADVVHYAHENGVVHRDLKPGNILIAPDGSPRLLDFGIARVMDSARLNAEQTAELGVGVFTPEYASPEQVRGEAITKSTDVYALGLLLYELLTGTKAQGFERINLGELFRVICQESLERPSVSASANNRPLPRSLAGDIDAMIDKATQKTAPDRYATAAEFAADLRRCLNSEPIIARDYGVVARALKFARRNRSAVLATSLILASLLGGLIASQRQARLADRRFRESQRLAHRVLYDVYDATSALPGSTRARAAILTAASDHLDAIAKEAGNDTTLRHELMAAYLRLGDVLGDFTASNLGRPAEALAAYQKGLALAQVLAQDRRDTVAIRHLAALHRSIGRIHSYQAAHDAALQSFHEGLRVIEREREAARLRDIRLEKVALLAALSREQERDAAIKTARSAVAVAEGLTAESRDLPSLSSLGDALMALAVALRSGGSPTDVITVYQTLADLRRETLKLSPEDRKLQRDLMTAYGGLGDALWDANLDRTRARKYFAETVRVARTLADDPADVRARLDLGQALLREGLSVPNPELAIESLQEGRRALASGMRLEPENIRILQTLAYLDWQLGKQCEAAGRLDEAIVVYRRTIEATTQRLAKGDHLPSRTALYGSYGRIGGILTRRGSAADALAAGHALVDSMEKWRASGRRADLVRASGYYAAAEAAVAADPDTGRRWMANAVAIWSKLQTEAPLDAENVQYFARARAHMSSGKK